MDIFYFAPSLLSAALSDCTSPWRLCFQFVPPRWWRCFRIVLSLDGCAFRSCRPVGGGAFGLYFPLAAVFSDCAFPLSNIFSDGASQQNVLVEGEKPKICFSSIGKPIGKSIRKSDSTTRSVRPILRTQAAAVAVHMYTSTAFSIYPPICTHCTSKSQQPYNHRTIYHAITAPSIARSICRQSASAVQASYAQCAAKVQAPRKYRTLNLSPKCKHRASIARSMCRQSASTVQASYAQSVAKAQALCKQRPFCRLFRAFSLQNLPFHPSSCSRRSQNG